MTKIYQRATKLNPTILGIALLFLATLSFWAFASTPMVFVVNVAMLAAVGAIALNFLMGTAGQVSIGNAAFLTAGGFGTVFMLRSAVPFPLDVAMGGVIAGFFGLLAGLPALRLRGLYLVLSTLAAHFIVVFFAQKYQQATVGVPGFISRPLFASQGMGGAQRYWAWLLFVVLSLVIVGASRLMRNRAGRALRMIRDHEPAAALLGIPVVRYKITAFVLTSVLIGVQGGLAFHLTGSINNETYGLMVAVQYLAMVLIGGLDSILGAIIGAALIVLLPEFVPDVVGTFTSTRFAENYGAATSQIVYGTLLVVFVLSSPNGVVGFLKSAKEKLIARIRSADNTGDGR